MAEKPNVQLQGLLGRWGIPSVPDAEAPHADATQASTARVEASASVAAARAEVDRLHEAWERHVAGCRRCEPWRGVRCPDGQALQDAYYLAWRRWVGTGGERR